MNDNLLISIVIPVYNSGKTINTTVQNVLNVFKGVKYDCEIILINDGSIDNSSLVCENLIKTTNKVSYIEFSKNFGQHNAILAGLRYASGDYILFMDDDLQTPSSEVLKLVDAIIANNKDVVYGQYQKKEHSFFRNIGSKVNSFMAQALINKPKDITLTSFFIIKKYVAIEIKKYNGAYPYLAGLILQVTDNIGMVEVIHKKREYGKSNYTFRKLLGLWINGFTSFSIKPLRISGLIGVLFAIIGFILSLVLIINRYVNSYVYSGWTSIMVTAIFIGGIQLISLWLIGEYVGRIFLSINGKPQYVIKHESVNKYNNFINH